PIGPASSAGIQPMEQDLAALSAKEVADAELVELKKQAQQKIIHLQNRCSEGVEDVLAIRQDLEAISQTVNAPIQQS
ncbi:MAG: hypothetical protein LQ347_006340, partial [Umbilicaria vellea]